MQENKILKPYSIGYSYGCGFDTYDIEAEEIIFNTVEEFISEVRDYIDIASGMISDVSSCEDESDECSYNIFIYAETGELIKDGDSLIMKNGEIINPTHKKYKLIFNN